MPGFTHVPGAIEQIRTGCVVAVVDDECLENEGDLAIAAEKVEPEMVNLMAAYNCGLICLAMKPEPIDELCQCPISHSENGMLVLKP